MTAKEELMSGNRVCDGVPLNHRNGPAVRIGTGLAAVEHWIDAPLDYDRPGGQTIQIFAREYRATDDGAESRPWLLYLQGGPGCAGTRYLGSGGWLAEAVKHFRVLQLDQRGTGLSHPLNRNTLAGTPEEIAATLRFVRADSIVRDAERFRAALDSGPWHTHGQSYGGFITATYLSFAPEGLAGSMITGGIPPLAHGVDDVYRATYRAVAARQDEVLGWYDDDKLRLADVYERVRTGRERLDGQVLRPGHVQRLGMLLGGNTRVHQLHYALRDAFERSADGEWGLTDSFKRLVWNQFSQESTPLYSVMHETIYAEEEATRWSAWRVAGELPEFAESADSPRLTGEMIYPWHVQTDPATAALFEAADVLAHDDSLGALYDRPRLASNTVPVAAAVYTDDIYVPRDLSLTSAAQIGAMTTHEWPELHHDGIAEKGSEIFCQLARSIGVDIPS